MWLCGITFLLLTILNQVHARYRPNATDNLVVYYGQNSWGSQHSDSKFERKWQGRLKEYCDDTTIDVKFKIAFMKNTPKRIQVINIAFLIDMVNLKLNLANLDGGDEFCPHGLDYCQNMEDDIKTCQDNGIDIVLSIGGERTHLQSFNNSLDAQRSAQKIWEMFGPKPAGYSRKRPFGKSEVDGFDLDIEDPNIKYLPEWAEEMRRLTENHTILLTASPECSHHQAGGPMADLLKSDVTFDYMNVQFYNNENCWVKGKTEIESSYLKDWSNWANSTKSQWLVGLAAGETACNQKNCYKKDLKLFDKPKTFSGFSGGMVWDLSQSQNNGNFHQEVKKVLT